MAPGAAGAHVGEVAADVVRGAYPSKDRSSTFGSSASFGLPGCASKRFLPYALERPFPLMMRDIRLRLAATSRRSSDALTFLAPYLPLLSAWTARTSGSTGSGAGGGSVRERRW